MYCFVEVLFCEVILQLNIEISNNKLESFSLPSLSTSSPNHLPKDPASLSEDTGQLLSIQLSHTKGKAGSSICSFLLSNAHWCFKGINGLIYVAAQTT